MGRVKAPSAIALKRTEHLLQRYKQGDSTARRLLASAWEAGAKDAALALHPPAMEAENARLREVVAIGERFVDACFSAWSCGEPAHRVRTMLDRADEFRAALDTLSTEQVSQ